METIDKLDGPLRERLRHLGAAAADMRVPVIVTVTPPIDLAVLRDSGLKIAEVHRLIDAVSGSIAAADLERLARLGNVRTIELDGEMRAI
jgi:hypothetical protein